MWKNDSLAIISCEKLLGGDWLTGTTAMLLIQQCFHIWKEL